MAALPPFNTERWWIVYTNNGTTHRLMMRTNAGATAANVSLTLQGVFSRLAPILYATSILGLEFSVINSNVRNAATYSGTASFGTGSGSGVDTRARALSFVGRSPDGRKNRLFVFGAKDISEGDYRVDTTESTDVAALVTYLNGATGAFLSISGAQPVYKNYANIGFNDHWIKAYRKAGG